MPGCCSSCDSGDACVTDHHPSPFVPDVSYDSLVGVFDKLPKILSEVGISLNADVVPKDQLFALNEYLAKHLVKPIASDTPLSSAQVQKLIMKSYVDSFLKKPKAKRFPIFKRKFGSKPSQPYSRYFR